MSRTAIASVAATNARLMMVTIIANMIVTITIVIIVVMKSIVDFDCPFHGWFVGIAAWRLPILL